MTTQIQLGHQFAARHYQLNQRDIFPKPTKQHRVVKMENVRKLTKLELLQEDYRSRLLHEKEQKLNDLFDRKVRANTIPKQGSVREFFLNRRMISSSTTTKTRHNPRILPPIPTSSRYENVQLSKKGLPEERRLHNIERATLITKQRTENNTFTKFEEPRSELTKLRQKRQRAQKSVQIETTHDQRPKSKEKHSSVQPNNFKTTERKSTLPRHRLRRLSKEAEPYKRGRKLSSKVDTSQDNSCKLEELCLYEKNQLSQSLAKIKELSRRKTVEFLERSLTGAKPAIEMSETSKRSQRVEEMHKLELELRETISREQKKLYLLQQKQEAVDKNQERLSTAGTEKPRAKIPPKQRITRDKSSRTGGNIPMTNESETKRQEERNAASKPEVSNLKSSFDSSLLTCSNCGRSFMKERIVKHENACKKASARKKKPFDARKKRAEGTELDKYLRENSNNRPTSEAIAVTALL